MNGRKLKGGMFVFAAVVLAALLAGCGRASALVPETRSPFVARAGNATVSTPGAAATPAPGATPCKSASASQICGDRLARTNDAGAVSIRVTPLNLAEPGSTLDFRVSLNTHSVELNYDLTKMAVLRDDQGREYAAAAWEGSSGGHHVQGVLKFDDGSSIVKPGVKSLELELKGIAQVPSRTFRWEIP